MADNGKDAKGGAADDDFTSGGFQDQTTPEIDGWYKPEIGFDKVKKIGPTILGQVVGRITIENDDGERDVVIVKLLQPAKAQDADDKERTIDLAVGQCLGVGIRYNLRELLSFVEHRGVVKFRPTELQKLKGGRTMWKFQFAAKGKKSAPPAPAKKAEASADGELPF